MIFLYSFVHSLFLIDEINLFKNFSKIKNIVLAVISTLILVLYVLIFSFLWTRLKTYYPQYHLKHRKALLTLFTAITFSLVVRTVFMIILSIPDIVFIISDEALNDSVVFFLQNSFNFIFSFLVPQVIMLYSLVYSVKQRRNLYKENQ